MSSVEGVRYYPVRFPRIPVIDHSIRLFDSIHSSFAPCYFGSGKAYMTVSDLLPDEAANEPPDTKFRRIFEEDRPVIQLLQFGQFCAERAIEFNGPDGQPFRIVDPRDDETFNLLAGQYDKVATSPPVFRFRDRVNIAIQAAVFSDLKHTSQERIQVVRQISYRDDVAEKQESPYPNRFKNDPDYIADGVIPDLPEQVVAYLLENVYMQEAFDPDHILAAIKKIQRLSGSLDLNIERLYYYPPGKNSSIAGITFLGQYIDFAHKVLRDVRTRPPEQRYCILDALKIAASRKMAGRLQR